MEGSEWGLGNLNTLCLGKGMSWETYTFTYAKKLDLLVRGFGNIYSFLGFAYDLKNYF